MGRFRRFLASWSECWDRDQLQFPPTLENFVHNSEDKFIMHYSVVLGLVLSFFCYLFSFYALVTVFSAVLVLPLVHMKKVGGLTRAMITVLVVPHLFFIGWFGGKRVIFPFVLALVGVVLHAGCRKYSKKQESDGELVELGKAQLHVAMSKSEIDVLEEFRRHSKSVKEKYNL
jgi:hypothetical protein